jgi:hypothetical protein
MAVSQAAPSCTVHLSLAPVITGVQVASPKFVVKFVVAETEMVVQGTHFSAQPSLLDYFEEAYSRCGLDCREGYMVKEASRSLLFLLKEWNNRGIHLWTLVAEEYPIQAGKDMVEMPLDTFDVMHAALRTQSGSLGQQDYYMRPLSADEYANIPSKRQRGRPVQYWLDRSSRWPRFRPWPVPDVDSIFALTRVRNLRTPPPGLGGDADVPDRMAAALVSGLAYSIGLKRVEARPMLQQLKEEYLFQLQLAESEDREKAPLTIVPEIAWTL